MLVLIDAVGALDRDRPVRPPGDLAKLILTALIIAAVVVAVALLLVGHS